MGFILPTTKNSNENLRFHRLTNSDLRCNRSVIPVWGSSQAVQFKVAAIRRTTFSHIKAFNAIVNVSFSLIPLSAANESLKIASYMEGFPI